MFSDMDDMPTSGDWDLSEPYDDRKSLKKLLDQYDIELIEEYVRQKKLERIKGNIKRKGDR